MSGEGNRQTTISRDASQGEDYRDLAHVDRIVHEPSRLIIMALLFPLEHADFLFLLRETGLTKGNLSAHLARLEEAGYVAIAKTFRGKVPQTICHLTEDGRTAFRDYRERLKRAVESMPE
ncbi:MAG: winged helix-turn-helix domain-containing protein [Chloroflexota bacterium]